MAIDPTLSRVPGGSAGRVDGGRSGGSAFITQDSTHPSDELFESGLSQNEDNTHPSDELFESGLSQNEGGDWQRMRQYYTMWCLGCYACATVRRVEFARGALLRGAIVNRTKYCW